MSIEIAIALHTNAIDLITRASDRAYRAGDVAR
jgi:hypothetical protein